MQPLDRARAALCQRLVSVTGRTTAAVEAEQSRGGNAARCRAVQREQRLKRYKTPYHYPHGALRRTILGADSVQVR